MGDRKLTTADVAERYRTSPGTVRYWRHTGYLPLGTRFGRKVLYDERDLEAWERQRADDEAAAREPTSAA
jgi:DNA-binding transcriptional MerR regulator